MADIIAFPFDRLCGARQSSPSAPVSPSRNPAPKPAGRLQTASMDDSVVRAITICATRPPAPLSALPDSAWVIGTALRWIRRRGKARQSIPALVLGLLDRHIAAGDPAARMFSDWLDGRAPPNTNVRDFEMNETPEPTISQDETVSLTGGE